MDVEDYVLCVSVCFQAKKLSARKTGLSVGGRDGGHDLYLRVVSKVFWNAP